MDDNLIELKNALDEENNGLEYEKFDDGMLLFKATKYQSEIFKNFREFQETEKFCDIVLKTNERTNKYIKAHKLVLASASPYFRAMFTGGLYKIILFKYLSI